MTNFNDVKKFMEHLPRGKEKAEFPSDKILGKTTDISIKEELDELKKLLNKKT